MLEFAATVDQAIVASASSPSTSRYSNCSGSLQDSNSPYAGLLAAVLATLPPITADRRRITELAADGPPEEDVGLDPFGMDPMMMDPALAGGRR